MLIVGSINVYLTVPRHWDNWKGTQMFLGIICIIYMCSLTNIMLYPQSNKYDHPFPQNLSHRFLFKSHIHKLSSQCELTTYSLDY